jgi:hypothetical protein
MVARSPVIRVTVNVFPGRETGALKERGRTPATGPAE